MIKSSELRIGNKLNYHSAEGDILLATFDCKDLKWISEDETSFNLVHSPIQLTEEILVKFGFVPSKFHRSTIFKKGKIYLRKCQSHYKYGNCAKLNYVHQLQNLIYALTGKELNYQI
jgi:hypothetical protein